MNDPRKPRSGWSPRLARSFTPVANAFLRLYHKLGPHEGAGLTSTEAMLVIHLMHFKWDHRDPYPSVAVLAERMGMNRRSVRKALRALEERGLLERRMPTPGQTTRYHLQPLFDRLEQLLDEELEAAS